jgi:hypothetical protein
MREFPGSDKEPSGGKNGCLPGGGRRVGIEREEGRRGRVWMRLLTMRTEEEDGRRQYHEECESRERAGKTRRILRGTGVER